MADWRKIAMAAILADGKVDENEVSVLKKELKGESGKIEEEGLGFLLELRSAALKRAKAKKEDLTDAFENFFNKVVIDKVVKEGKIDADAVTCLKTNLYGGKVDDKGWAALQNIGKKAKEKSPEFETLVKDVETARTKAAPKAAAPKKEKTPS